MSARLILIRVKSLLDYDITHFPLEIFGNVIQIRKAEGNHELIAATSLAWLQGIASTPLEILSKMIKFGQQYLIIVFCCTF